MFKHLLVPIDGSPTSELAVDKAIGLAKAAGQVTMAALAHNLRRWVTLAATG